ncbi:MAG TPA: DAK2 domain-containing protein, partial [Candidatus Agathobaculum pullicola]|nr:DAK2 domain-containing protein [Candidatus Agathobaculum pullicola]
GLKSVFTDLGVDVVVRGGQTMNPSTDDIVRAVDAVPAEIVFVLPNNKNIIMAAEQAVHLSEEKKIIVVPTKTIPQGMSAMLAVDPDGEDENLLAQAMRDAAAHVRSGQVTYAARDSEFDGKRIKQGEYLSLSEGKLCASGREASVIKKLVREMVSDDSAFATVIYGEGVSAEQAAEVEALLHKENKELEISVIDGGQPVYYYILSVE